MFVFSSFYCCCCCCCCCCIPLLYLAVWVCTAALAILDRLDVVDLPMLGWWLAERQLPNGGMNGRPEKLEDVCIFLYICIPICCGDDPSRANNHISFPFSNRILQVCYSHWVLSSMAILNKLTWIDSAALTRFILSAQVRNRMYGCSTPRLFCVLCLSEE